MRVELGAAGPAKAGRAFGLRRLSRPFLSILFIVGLTGAAFAQATTTTLVSSSNPSVFGQSVTFTATVAESPPGATPTGSVNFVIDGGAPVNVALDGAGQATYTTSALTRATHPVVASYTSDAALDPSTSSTLNQVVNEDSTTTTVVATPNPVVTGQPVLITATVTANAPGSGTPTGTITFTGPGAYNSTATMSGGQASVTVTLTSGIITATYNGEDPGFAFGSGTVGLFVDPADTDVSVSASPNPSVLGQSVTVTATVAVVSPGTGTPTGTVTFTGPGGLNTTVAVDGSGQASFTSSSLSPGTITATYNGSSGYNSDSGTTSFAIAAGDTTTALTASPNPAVTGQSVTYTATVTAVSPATGTPTGTVTFTGPGGLNSTVAVDGSGVATLTDSGVPTGTVTATYNGDTDFNGSDDSLSFTRNQASTTTNVIASPDPSATGETVTLTATVTVDAPGTGTPTGTVTFTGPGGLNDTVAVNGSGVATTTTTGLADGTVTATYNGDADYSGSSDTVDVTIDDNATTTVASSLTNPSVTGEIVTWTVTVTSPFGTPTGTVTFTTPAGINTTSGLDGSGNATAVVAVEVTSLVTVTYNGDTGFGGSSDSFTQTVNAADTTTALTDSPDPTVTGEDATLTATIGVVAPGQGTPTGTVTFSGPGGFSETITLSGGVATYTGPVPNGTITATYNGSSAYNTSSDTTAHTTNQASTTTTASSSPEPSVYGQSVLVSATVTPVSPGSGTPTGNVTFTGPGGLNQTVALSGGTASFSSTTLTAGTITATYAGDADYTGSSDTTDVTINDAATSTGVVASPNPHVDGDTVTLTATVAATPPGAGTPTGTVTFTGPGSLNVTVAVDGSGVASTTTSTLPAGTVTATYNGDTNFAGSSGTVGITLAAADTTTALAAAPNPSTAGESVTFTATVSVVAPGTGTPTGTVTFTGPGGFSATGTLNGSGIATVSTTALGAGTNSITATYNGDANYNGSTSSALSQIVNQGTSTTALASSLNPSEAGDPVTFTATVTSSFGTPTGDVEFREGATVLGTGTLASGVTTLTIDTLTEGDHSIVAYYLGSPDHAASNSAPLVQAVAIPVDSIRLRGMQIIGSRAAALASGDAFSSAVGAAIDGGFGGRDGASLGGDGLRMSYELAPGTQAWGHFRITGVGDWTNAGTLNGMQFNGYGGITHQVTSDLAIGVLGGYETFDYESDTLDGELEGSGWTVGGYSGANLNGLRLSLAGGYTRLGYDVSSGAATGSFAADRFMATAGASGDIELGASLFLKPSVTAFGMIENQDAYTDSHGYDQAARSVSSGRITAGAELSTELGLEGVIVTPHIGIAADYTTAGDATDLTGLGGGLTDTASGGLSATATAGVDAVFDTGEQLGIAATLSGLTAETSTWSLDGRLGKSF